VLLQQSPPVRLIRLSIPMDDVTPLRRHSQRRRNGDRSGRAAGAQQPVIREVDRDACPGSAFIRERAIRKTQTGVKRSQSCSSIMQPIEDVPGNSIRGDISHQRIQRRQEERRMTVSVIGRVLGINDSDSMVSDVGGSLRFLHDDFADAESQVVMGRLIDDDDDLMTDGLDNFRRSYELFARQQHGVLDGVFLKTPTTAVGTVTEESNLNLLHGGRLAENTPTREGTGSAYHRLPLIDEDETELTSFPDLAAMYGSMTEQGLMQDNDMSGSHGMNSSFNSSTRSSLGDSRIIDVMEIFPDVSLTRVEDLLRGYSLTSTLIVLAEESNNPVPDDDSNRQTCYNHSQEESTTRDNLHGFDHHPRRDEIISRVLDIFPEANVSDVDRMLMGSRRPPNTMVCGGATNQNEDINAAAQHTELQRVDRPVFPVGGLSEIGVMPQTLSGLARQASNSFFCSTLDVDVPVYPIQQYAAAASAPPAFSRGQSSDEYYLAKSKHGRVTCTRRRSTNDTDSSSDEDDRKPRSKHSSKGPSWNRETSPTLDDLKQLLSRERQNKAVLNSTTISQCYDISTAALL
jgi:hypothetical protein